MMSNSPSPGKAARPPLVVDPRATAVVCVECQEGVLGPSTPSWCCATQAGAAQDKLLLRNTITMLAKVVTVDELAAARARALSQTPCPLKVGGSVKFG